MIASHDNHLKSQPPHAQNVVIRFSTNHQVNDIMNQRTLLMMISIVLTTTSKFQSPRCRKWSLTSLPTTKLTNKESELSNIITRHNHLKTRLPLNQKGGHPIPYQPPITVLLVHVLNYFLFLYLTHHMSTSFSHSLFPHIACVCVLDHALCVLEIRANEV